MIHPAPKNGFISIILILIILIFSFMLGSDFFSVKNSSSLVLPSGSPSASVAFSGCCENAECDPSTTSKRVTFEQNEYGLLKSSVRLSENVLHLIDSDSDAPDGPIIVNTTNEPDDHGTECDPNEAGQDLLAGAPECVIIPDDQLIYVCREGCFTPEEFSCRPEPGAPEYCYGTRDQTIYDVYFRLSDLATTGVPDIIKNCSNANQPIAGDKKLVTPSPGVGQNLQLKSFSFDTILAGESKWVSPFCKPAIYLYPEKTTEVNVKVKAVEMSSTIPKYPLSGWTVLASPNGDLNYQNSSLDYLYYESKVPSSLVKRPDHGWVMEGTKLDQTLESILPKLGLNPKEAWQFRDYWLSVLPESSYYLIGIMDESVVEQMSQLEITPKPQSSLRVILYFEALDSPIKIAPPTLESGTRAGFTVVEWGGVVKSEGEFSCLL